jgi:hypothetical protein
MAGSSANQSPGLNFGELQTSSMNQGFNSLNPSHMVGQQNQWITDSCFPPNDPSLNIFNSLDLFDPTGTSNLASLAGLRQQHQLLPATVNNENNVPLSGTQMMGGG